jgi:hypothetical protein
MESLRSVLNGFCKTIPSFAKEVIEESKFFIGDGRIDHSCNLIIERRT